ncbi:MAG: arginine--tRNA ligase [Spirochaetales bacterium]|nr:arginine--tRNA ligase [Spirochaetales bacterium]
MIQKKILEKIENCLIENEEFSKLDFSKLSLSIPKNISHGDFSTNFALIISSELKTNPNELANKMTSALLAKKDTFFKSVNVVEPGFVNFQIADQVYQDYLKEINNHGNRFGSSKKKQKKVLIEFVSANPTGPLHLGHLRNAAVGDSISRILLFAGYDVVNEYYLNDYGSQIELLGESLQSRVHEILSIKKEIPEGGYKGEYLIDLAKNLTSKEDRDFLLKSNTEYFSNFATAYLIEEIKKDLGLLNISFDSWFSEKKDIHTSKYLNEIQDTLDLKKGVYTKDNAEWIRTSKFGDNNDWVIKKSDGSSTYFMNDIAYHQTKFKRGFDLIINIWGADHHSHISRLKASMNLLSNDTSKMIFILIQFVRLVRNDEDVSMSKRSGTYTTVRDLLSEFNKDLVRFLMISRSSDTHFDFDLDKCREDSEENPVFYIQYANARINSVLQKSPLKNLNYKNLSTLNEEKEIALIKRLLNFPDIVNEAADNFAPHKVAFYLQGLASEFHAYYKSTKILVEDDTVVNGRLVLLSSIKIVLMNGLNLLGVSSPDKM